MLIIIPSTIPSILSKLFHVDLASSRDEIVELLVVEHEEPFLVDDLNEAPPDMSTLIL